MMRQKESCRRYTWALLLIAPALAAVGLLMRNDQGGQEVQARDLLSVLFDESPVWSLKHRPSSSETFRDEEDLKTKRKALSHNDNLQHELALAHKDLSRDLQEARAFVHTNGAVARIKREDKTPEKALDDKLIDLQQMEARTGKHVDSLQSDITSTHHDDNDLDSAARLDPDPNKVLIIM